MIYGIEPIGVVFFHIFAYGHFLEARNPSQEFLLGTQGEVSVSCALELVGAQVHHTEVTKPSCYPSVDTQELNEYLVALDCVDAVNIHELPHIGG